MTGRPSGTVTFLFTDVEGSTAAWESRAGAMKAALPIHDEAMRAAVAAHGGTVFAGRGDGVAAVFDRADGAVTAAIAAQAALAVARWPGGLVLRVRMGLHTGEAHERDGDYFGPAVNRAARVMDAANGSQILVSAATRATLAGDLEDVTFVDLGAHELRDVTEPMRLYRVHTRRFTTDPRPPRAIGAPVGNLPSVPTALIGREDEVIAVIEDLETSNLVTLAGVGGIGKTRLALEVGRRLHEHRRDGVWFAPLDAVDRPEALRRMLLGTLSIEPRHENDLDSLVEGLRFRDSLLVLDNCEHLLDAVAEVATAILATCPHVQILATSREPLDVDGERARRIRSLNTDDDGSAIALFMLRASEAGAPLDPDLERDDVARICRRLDGIPLAIELAAARARSLRPADIAERLDDMLRLLTGGRRGRTERHRTLRATLEWSYEMLSTAERALLDRLSIFAGAFTLAAAESVAEGEPVGADDLLDLVDRLVARSLLVPVEAGGENRYRLLEPVRHLAAEKLAARGETDAARDRHTRWYLGLMTQLGDGWRNGDDQRTWPIAQRELPNLRVAFDHLAESSRADDAQRFAVDAFGVVSCQFDNVVNDEWAERSVLLDADHVGPWTAAAWALAAWGRSARGETGVAAEWLGRAEAATRAGSRDDGLVVAAAMFNVWSGGSAGVSDELLQDGLDGALASDDLHRQVWVLSYSGRFDETMAVARRLGNQTLLALAHAGITGVDDGTRWDAAESFWDAAQRSHSVILLNHAAHRLGVEHIRAGAPADGLLLLRAPLRDWLLRADRRVWDVMHAVAWGLAVGGDAAGAARLLGSTAGRDRPLHREHQQLGALLERALPEAERARHHTDGARLDAGGAVTEALERIETLLHATRSAGDADPPELTLRQQEVAALVARGLTNKQIAQRLAISRFTAETHVRNILERLGAATRSEIATWAAKRDSAPAGDQVPRTPT